MLLEATRKCLLLNYLSISQSLQRPLSKCLCETKWLGYFPQPLGALICEQKLLSCIRRRDKPFWIGYSTFKRAMWGTAEATLRETMRKAELFVENNGRWFNISSWPKLIDQVDEKRYINIDSDLCSKRDAKLCLSRAVYLLRGLHALSSALQDWQKLFVLLYLIILWLFAFLINTASPDLKTKPTV